MGLAELVDEFKRVVSEYVNVSIIDRYVRVTNDSYETMSNMLTLSYIVAYLVVDYVSHFKSWLRPSKPLVEISVVKDTLPSNIVGDVVRVLVNRAETNVYMAVRHAEEKIDVTPMIPFEARAIAVIHNHRSEVEKAVDYLKAILGRINANVTPDLYITNIVGEKGKVASLYSGHHRTRLDVIEQIIDELGYDSREEVKPLYHYKRIVHYTKKFGDTIVWFDVDDKGFGFIRVYTRLNQNDMEIIERLDTVVDYLKDRYKTTIANITLRNIENKELEMIIEEIEQTLSEFNQA